MEAPWRHSCGQGSRNRQGHRIRKLVGGQVKTWLLLGLRWKIFGRTTIRTTRSKHCSCRAHRPSRQVLARPPSRDLTRHGCRVRAYMDVLAACPAMVGGQGPCSQAADPQLCTRLTHTAQSPGRRAKWKWTSGASRHLLPVGEGKRPDRNWRSKAVSSDIGNRPPSRRGEKARLSQQGRVCPGAPATQVRLEARSGSCEGRFMKRRISRQPDCRPGLHQALSPSCARLCR